MSKKQVHIIGAGPAGLTVGYFLAKNGAQPILYEASTTVGGLAGSVNYWGTEFDIGPHILLESCQEKAVEFWLEIAGEQIIRLDLSRGMILNKTMVEFPPNPQSIFRAYGIIGAFKASITLILARVFGPRKHADAGTFFKKRYGKFFRNRVFNPFCEKYMGCPDSEVDLEFAHSLTSFVKESGDDSRELDEKKLNTILYPSKGTKSVWLELAKRIESEGTIEFEKRLSKIETSGKLVTALIFEDGSRQEVEEVITSLPLPVLLRALPDTPEQLLKDVLRLKARGTVLVYLKVNQPGFKPQYVTVFDHSLKVGRITNFNSWKVDSSNDSTVLCLEYWCEKGDEIWQLEKEEMIELAQQELHDSNVVNANEVVAGEVLKLGATHPIVDIAHIDILKNVSDYVDQFSNLHLAGRHAKFTWDGQADNIEYGRELAERIALKDP